MVLTGKACGPDGVPALAPLPQPATSNANASRTVVCIVNFFIIINLLMLPDLGAPDIWIKAEPPPIQFRRVRSGNVLGLAALLAGTTKLRPLPSVFAVPI